MVRAEVLSRLDDIFLRLYILCDFACNGKEISKNNANHIYNLIWNTAIIFSSVLRASVRNKSFLS